MVKVNKNRIYSRSVAAFLAVLIFIAAAVLSGCAPSCGVTDTKKWILQTIKANYYYYDEMDKEGLEDLSVEEIVSRLDVYSDFYSAEELQALIKDNSGEKAGIGFSYTFVGAGKSSVYPEGGCLLILVVGNSPAEKAGLKSGMLLTSGSYNGQSARFDVSGALEEFIDTVPAGVEFTLSASTGETFTVAKQEYCAGYMFMATNYAAWSPVFNEDNMVNGLEKDSGRAIEYLPDGAAYVSMSQFYGTAAEEFGYIVAKFNAEGCTSLILDLRNNGGGYVDVMQDMAGYFTSSLGSGTHLAMTAVYRGGREEVYNCKSHNESSLITKDTEIYVLANSGTASASEALIGVLVSYGFLKYENIFLSDYGEEFMEWAGEDYKTAQSYGKGIMQTTFTNWFTHEALKLTTAQINWPNGNCIHGVGLTAADGCRTVKTDWVVTPDDAELKSVINMIKE